MNFLENFWARLKWILVLYFKTKKKLYPLALLGTKLIIASITLFPALGFVVNIAFPKGFFISDLQFESQSISLINILLCVSAFLIGLILIFIDVRKLGQVTRSTSKVLITGMLGTNARFPLELMSRPEYLDSRETVELGIPEILADSISVQINMFNSEVAVRIYERFILNQNCTNLYLGGLARIPFLVAYGVCFRAISAKIIYFDRFHLDGDWKLLDDEEQGINLIYDEPDSILPNTKGQIGISISFTKEIKREQLPEKLVNNTLQIKSNFEDKRNLVTSQTELEKISYEIQTILDKYSSQSKCEEIHIFISAQSTVALEIGRRFQEGIHKKWIVHNFNAQIGNYDWALEIKKDCIEEYDNLFS